MATLFEAWLVGDDEEHLAAVGEASLDEIERVELVLSRFDRGSELQRVNREAALAPVRVSCELYAVLEDCLRRSQETDGFFDVTATAAGMPAISRAERFHLDPEKRTVVFTDASVQLDLGGYGKGYALDAAATIFDQFGVRSFLLHGGTSSILARGTAADGGRWLVALGDPFQVDRATLDDFPLVNAGLSTSAAWDARHVDADIVDPHTQITATADEAFCVTAPTATEAEVLSTALTAMGSARAEKYLLQRRFPADSAYSVRLVERTLAGSSVRRIDDVRPMKGTT